MASGKKGEFEKTPLQNDKDIICSIVNSLIDNCMEILKTYLLSNKKLVLINILGFIGEVEHSTGS